MLPPRLADGALSADTLVLVVSVVRGAPTLWHGGICECCAEHPDTLVVVVSVARSAQTPGSRGRCAREEAIRYWGTSLHHSALVALLHANEAGNTQFNFVFCSALVNCRADVVG